LDNFWQAPFNSNVTNNRVYLNIDDTIFFIDGNNNLILNNIFWRKDVSTNTEGLQTQRGLSSRGHDTLAHSESGEEGLHSTAPVYPSWDKQEPSNGNYWLGNRTTIAQQEGKREVHVHPQPPPRRRAGLTQPREGGTRPPPVPTAEVVASRLFWPIGTTSDQHSGVVL
jgi:hypothetical protein